MPTSDNLLMRRLFSTPDRIFIAVAATLLLNGCSDPLEPGPITRVLTNAPVPADERSVRGTRLANFDADGRQLVRFDRAGNSLDAHDGEIERFGERYYLYGASYGCGFEVTISGTPFCGIKSYSSPDLIHWTDEGFLFDPGERVWQERCHGGRYGCFRPHVARSPATGKYVLWLNTYEVEVGFRVFESDSPTGPYRPRPVPELATNRGIGIGHTHGDHNLFVDADGSGYLVYTDWVASGDIVVEQLTPDLLTGTGRSHRLGIRGTEAPSIFRRGSTYYMTLSDPNCGYCRTGTSYVTALNPLGPWSPRIHITLDSCGGQPSHVAPLATTTGDTAYVYQSDLWVNFEFNQAPAAQFWSALRFNPDGSIQPIECAPAEELPLPTFGGESADPALRAVLICDVDGREGGAGTGPEIRFVADEDGFIRNLVLPLYKRGGIAGPLLIDLVADGRVQKRVRVADADLAWNARTHVVQIDSPVRRGVQYGLRLSTDERRGCFGLAYFDRDNAAELMLPTGTFDGSKWLENPELAIVATVELSAS